ncbi:hypothetical protein AK812_SmicGene38110 [Symbiodinium microadriaticum]|uniref:Apple domain-containing protein n=1 Tax=Symbiodinium microadriaticum TaxID=2951 RepID=A0A1Q9CEV2_SYMMI|nr:hypothetical protein AK812_SmicGene38110 [Symbiodinium microadriaticum]
MQEKMQDECYGERTLVADEGPGVGDRIGADSIESCEAECSEIKGCESFAVCTHGSHPPNCHYKSKKVTLDEAATSHAGKLKDCKTLYKTKCKDAPHPQRFSKLGTGYCPTGYYAGWVAADGNLGSCKAKCQEEEKCRFFALYEGKTCSRYDSRAGDCNERVEEGGEYSPEQHTTFAKTEKVDPRYRKLGKGYCKSGYYAGWKAEDAISLAVCAAKCGTESQCHYFAFVEGKTCSRYTGDAKDCSDRQVGDDRADEHITYAKTQETQALYHFTKLGIGYCSLGYYAGWIPAESTLQGCKAKCEAESGCRFFALYEGKTCSRYDSRAGDCSQRVTQGGQFFPESHVLYAKSEQADPRFRKLGSGYCLSGYYDGWKKEDAASLPICAAKCGAESQCHYFALVEGKTCSRYTIDAKDCSNRHPADDHTTYAKIAEVLGE